MAQFRTYMRAFNGGEIAPSLYARIDDAKYQTGLATCKNFLVEPQGPISKRPGFAYVNQVKDSSKHTRLIPFIFNSDQSLVLEFGEKYVRFHTQGQTVLGSDGQPYEVATPYLEDDLFDIHYVQSADVVTLVHPSHAPRELKRYGATDWRLEEINFLSTLKAPGAPKVEQHIASSVSNKTDYVREYAVTSLDADGKNESERSESTSIECNPYGDGAYNKISWDAVAGVSRYRVYRKEGGIWGYIGETTETTINDENINPDASITPPLYDDPFTQSKGISSVTVTAQGSGYAVNAIEPIKAGDLTNNNVLHHGSIKLNYNENGGLQSKALTIPSTTDARAKELLAQGWPCLYDCGTVYGFSVIDLKNQNSNFCLEPCGPGSGAQVTYKRYNFSVGDSSYSIFYDIEITAGGAGYVDPALSIRYRDAGTLKWKTHWYDCARWRLKLQGLPSVTVTDSTGSGAEFRPIVQDGKVVAINVTRPGANYSSPVVTISDNSGSGAKATATVGQAGDFPSAVSYFEQRRFFGGTYNRPNNLWATRSGTESDMSYSLPTQDDDRISVRVAAREANRIEHIVPLSQLMILTASAEWRVTSLNSDAITPQTISVRPQSYVGSSKVQPLIVNNQMLYVSSRGGHLRECGYSYEAGGFITNDVSLRAPHLFDNRDVTDLSYSKAPWPIAWGISTAGNLVAFTYVPEQSVGAFSSVETDGIFESCCSVPEGAEDILYAVVRRIINGQSVRFVERMAERQYTMLEDSMFVDCAGTYRGEAKTEISGLTWLEGCEVAILADGSVEPRQVVKDGKITLTSPAGVVHVGLPYDADMKTLPIALSLQDGSYGSGHQKNLRKVFFRVVDSGGLKAGPDFDSLSEYPARSTEFAGSPPNTLSDEFGFAIAAKWSSSGQVCVRQDNPLPLRVISMTAELELV